MSKKPDAIAPLIPEVQRLLNWNHISDMNPGLYLDKYVASWVAENPKGDLQSRVQKPAIERLVQLTSSYPQSLDFLKLAERYRKSINSQSSRHFTATTISPLALHLARASSLENASVCLHPVYGFGYIPGSGLKGMAHAYACEIWLPTQGNPAKAFEQISEVFGSAPSPWLRDLLRSLNARLADPSRNDEIVVPKQSFAGAVVFHDAWPTQGPKLICDIVNNHHSAYYGAGDNGPVPPPGDWENPIPVYFAAIATGMQFEFAISPRRSVGVPPPSSSQSLIGRDGRSPVELATQWLAGALTHFGVGAKTNAGYGAFRIDPETKSADTLLKQVEQTWSEATRPSEPQRKIRDEFTCTLELITPAFLAGADHNDPAGCDLRPATLRGQLRWWWRTMHAGHLDPATLRKLETAIWGDSKTGGAVRISVEPVQGHEAVSLEAPFKKLGKSKKGEDKLDFDSSFAKIHDIEFGQAMTTQPLIYLAYGMDELDKTRVRRRRRCIWPGAQWKLTIVARNSKINGFAIPAADCLIQGRIAVWLLTNFGGVGSKARKGFGSIELKEPIGLSNLDECCDSAAALRRVSKLSNQKTPLEAQSIEAMCSLSQHVVHADCLELVTPWKNPWFALDQVGASLQSFAQAEPSTGHGKHCESKISLGLPRQIHGPLHFKLPHQKSHRAPMHLIGPKGDRHPAPAHFHIGRKESGSLVLRISAFPSSQLPNMTESRSMLEQLLEHLFVDLQAQTVKHKNRGQKWPIPPTTSAWKESGSNFGNPKSNLPKPGDLVEAVLLEEKTKKGGWRAKHNGSGIAGPIQNSAEVPSDKGVNDTLTLRVQSANEREIAFRYLR